MCEKSEGSLGCERINYLPGDRGFPENYLPKNNQESPQESSVEYLQAVAKVRLYLSKAAELLFDLHERTGKFNCPAVRWKCCIQSKVTTGDRLDTVSAAVLELVLMHGQE